MKKTIFLSGLSFIIFSLLASVSIKAQMTTTYAEKLGWKKGDRVVILHIDDAGMSYDSNIGTIRAMEEGVANSVSVMMPCPWVPGFVNYLKKNPDTDAGLHLTLTAEWQDYRWGPLVGITHAPGLVDKEGAMWRSVGEVVKHASADEVEAEITAQLKRARNMGFEPTHLDSHMGTLFARPDFLERYIKLGIENRIPVMFPGGHNSMIAEQLKQEAIERLKQEGKWKQGQKVPEPAELASAPDIGKKIWAGGLPVLDDLHNTSYGWQLPSGVEQTDENLQKMKTRKYMEAMRSMKPGVTMVIMHCTQPTEVFPFISGSAETRKGDLLAMIDPALRKCIEEEGIILTTWRELKMRRDKVK